MPAKYVRDHVELGYASTVHGAQGETVSTAHLLVREQTGAAAAYVGMTRGRTSNTAHLVAESVEDARRQWVEVFGRDRADLGPAHAAADVDRYGSMVRMQAAAINAEARRRLGRPEHERVHAPPSSRHSPRIGR